MKVIKTNEEFASPERRKAHFEKHVTNRRSNEFPEGTYSSSFSYERAADELAARQVHTSDVNSKDRYVGFVEKYKDGEELYVKYDKSTGALVVYKPTSRARTGNLIKTYYKVSGKDKYNVLFDHGYEREIEAGL